MDVKTIAVLGAGYVGLTSAALFAQAGFTVYIVEPAAERLDTIRSGRSFFYEQGIDAIIKAGIDNGALIATDSYEESVPHADVVFSCVGTPDNPDGSSNLSYVFSAAAEAARHAKPNTIYVQKSTVPVGTGRKIIDQFSEASAKISYVSNPEFLREGTAVYDTLFFDRIVAGSDNPETAETILSIYRRLETHRNNIAAAADIAATPRKGTYITVSLNSAELIKVTANAFLALKISFANSVAKLADASGADIIEVMNGVGIDERIGRAFLNAGRGYGGGCFPKDVSGLIASGREYGIDMGIMQAVQATNDSMPGYIVEKLANALDGDLRGVSVTVLGLSFKAGTSDVRRSPGIAIANTLADFGAEVTVYDPHSNSEAAGELGATIVTAETMAAALQNVSAVIIATEWPEFQDGVYGLSDTIIVDAVNYLDKDRVDRYIGVGRS